MTYSWYGAEVLGLLSCQSWMSSKMFQRDRDGEKECVHNKWIMYIGAISESLYSGGKWVSQSNKQFCCFMVTISSYHLTNIHGRAKCIQNYKSLEQSGEDIFENIIFYFVEVKFSCHNPTKCLYGYQFPIKINIKLSYKAIMIFNCLLLLFVPLGE